MEVVQVLCMKGGNGDTSYAQNSLLQVCLLKLILHQYLCICYIYELLPFIE